MELGLDGGDAPAAANKTAFVSAKLFRQYSYYRGYTRVKLKVMILEAVVETVRSKQWLFSSECGTVLQLIAVQAGSIHDKCVQLALYYRVCLQQQITSLFSHNNHPSTKCSSSSQSFTGQIRLHAINFDYNSTVVADCINTGGKQQGPQLHQRIACTWHYVHT